MIQFLGLHLGTEAASAVSLGRDLDVWARVRTPVGGAGRADVSRGPVDFPAAEWLRAGCFALQEAYLQLPVKARKVWGIALAGPEGWIALDVELSPLSPLRLVPPGGFVADFSAWRAANEKPARKIAAILSPQDYFRYLISGGLAADVASASRWGLVDPERAAWSEGRLDELQLERRFLPPVFDGPVPTGRLSEEGIRKTGLPGGLWLAAGAHEVEAALLASEDVTRPRLALAAVEGRRLVLGRGLDGLEPVTPPAGWRLLRSPTPGRQLLERELDAPSTAGADPASFEGELERARGELDAAGLAVEGGAPRPGAPEDGAAALAGIASGLVKGWGVYHQRRAAAPGA